LGLGLGFGFGLGLGLEVSLPRQGLLETLPHLPRL
jgi:hypothetical protein